MPDFSSPIRRVRILREEVSRKIAAGEVIDRPFSIVRELLDNAIDAGAHSIDVYLEAGGISRVRVVDDGAGMSGEDLALCWRPHATSKIESENDLLSVTSLGFRGEALSSMAVAGRLEIVSAREEIPAASSGTSAHRIVVRGGKLVTQEDCHGRKGTTAEVSELFFDFPARKKFLKGPSAESGLCRAAFIDRAIAHPSMGFRLFTDGALKSYLPVSSESERIALSSAQGGQVIDARLLGTGKADGNGFRVRVVAGEPSLRRRDRKLLQIFVNRRRVPEFSLIQAVEYGFAGYMPGGWFPIAFVFVDIDPALVDFNIHPAKKEVRFRSLPEIHSAVVSATRGLMSGKAPSMPRGVHDAVSNRDFAWIERNAPHGQGGGPPGVFFPPMAPQSLVKHEESEGPAASFLGQIFGVFLVFQTADRIVFLDQHAAHEKVIFERLSTKMPAAQELLIPVYFDVSEEEDRLLSEKTDALKGIGIEINREGNGSYQIVSLGPDFASLPEGELLRMLKDSIARGEEWKRDLMARAACRLALKEGDPVDAVTAAELFKAALSLNNPRCPHGRPIWHELTRDDLYRLVDRAPQI